MDELHVWWLQNSDHNLLQVVGQVMEKRVKMNFYLILLKLVESAAK